MLEVCPPTSDSALCGSFKGLIGGKDLKFAIKQEAGEHQIIMQKKVNT